MRASSDRQRTGDAGVYTDVVPGGLDDGEAVLDDGQRVGVA